MAAVDKIDKALGQYYSMLGRNDYFDENKIGQFKKECEDNGFVDDSDVKTELDADVDECMLIDFEFYDNFPFNEPPEDRLETILQILKQCYNNGSVAPEFTSKHIDLTLEDLKVDDEDIKKAEQIYSVQFTSIAQNAFSKEASLIKLFAINIKLNKPYLLSWIDMYLRDRVQSYLKQKQWCNFYEWSTRFRNDSCKIFDDHLFNSLKTTVHGHSMLIFPLQFPQTTVKDSMQEICEYINGMIDFIYKLVMNNEICPFQWDSAIVFNEVTRHMTNENDDDDDDGDDEKKENILMFGDVKKKLKAEKLLHTISLVDNKHKKERLFAQEFRTFQNMVENQKKQYNYPNYKRFCSLIDRRQPDKYKNCNVSKSDEIIFFEPPNNCNTIPKPYYVPEWFLDSSQTCFLPYIGYNNGIKQSNDNNDTDKPVTSKSVCEGRFWLLSFHVESRNTIKCYLTIYGQSLRFFASDIKDILPMYFDETFKGNKEFGWSKEAKTIIGNITPKLKDTKFDLFCKKY
eukprot:247948_1